MNETLELSAFVVQIRGLSARAGIERTRKKRANSGKRMKKVLSIKTEYLFSQVV
jgi:hypothetical protein